MIFSTSGGGGAICAAEKELDYFSSWNVVAQARPQGTGEEAHYVNLEPCAICCASGAAVGGIADLPPMAGIGGSAGYNYAVAAVLAFVAVVAFAAGGFYAKRRWLA